MRPQKQTTKDFYRDTETGEIFCKVINHYGDEVLKVYEITEVLSWR